MGTENKPKSSALESVVGANNRFALDLYMQYSSKDENIFFSPYSISTALAMTYEGAKGKTANEMKEVFHFPAKKALREGSAKLMADINSGEKDYRLNTANALWAEKDYEFIKKYFNTVEKHYGGKVSNMDFKNNYEGERQLINKWVEEKTFEKIKDLIPQGALDKLTRLVLTNAVYFKGNWLRQFDKEKTYEAEFRSPGGNVKAMMMKSEGEESKYNYAENDVMQALELPYSGKELSMLVLLPKEGKLSDLETAVRAGIIPSVRGSLTEQEVHVHMPRFKFETKYFMAETLKKMGMPTAFSESADFTGMTKKRELCISKVIHQAFVDVNEEGTEAAGATAVIVRELTCFKPAAYKVFKADHPFLFLIQQQGTGNILFMGRVSNPS